MYKVRVSKGALRNHFQYDLWKYGLGIVLTILTWSLITTMTAPQTPADKKVDIYLVGGYMMEDSAPDVESTILASFPELMEINIYNINVQAEMAYAGRQKLMAMLGSQTGDIYSFTKDEFAGMAQMGALLPLDNYDELKKHFTQEQLDEYTFATEDDPTPRLYGLPMTDIKLLGGIFFDTSNSAFGVMSYSKNSDKAVEVLQWIIENGK